MFSACFFEAKLGVERFKSIERVSDAYTYGCCPEVLRGPEIPELTR